MNRNFEGQNADLPLASRVRAALEQTYVVVVTFNPNLDVLVQQFSRLAEEGVKVVVVDNHSVMQHDVSELAAMRGFGIILLGENKGVAAAQNSGIDYVRSNGGKYVVFLDQDSIPKERAFALLVESFFSFPCDLKVGAVGSSYTLQSGSKGSSFVRFCWFRFEKIYCDPDSDKVHEVDFLISSGTFIPISVIDEAGPMQEKLFIDHVDTEWFLRAKTKGYRFYGCCSARLTHALGERAVRIWFGRWRTVPVHKGFRYFYTFRNSLWLYKQAHAPAKWISADVMRLTYIFLFSGLFVSPRRENIKWMLKGLRAGFSDIEDWPTVDVTGQAKDLPQG